MNSFSFANLALPTVCIFLFVFFVSVWALKSLSLAFLVSIVKSSFFFIYFYFIFDSTFTFLDDWSYLGGAERIVENGWDMADPQSNIDFAMSIAGGRHIAYYYHNAISIILFGSWYFSPVAINVIIASLIGIVGISLLKRELLLSSRDSKIFFLFLSFHPDIFSWSTIANLKDILVLFAHVCVLNGVSMLLRGKYLKSSAFIVPSIFLMLFTRFYLPFLFLIAFLTALLFRSKFRLRELLFVLLLAALAPLLIAVVGFENLQLSLIKVIPGISNLVTGAIRFLMTPIPFHTDRAYAFLNVSAIFNWASVPFAVTGFFMVVKFQGLFWRFAIFYFLAFVFLYGSFDELQGPRHRVQLDFIIALFQYLGYFLFFRSLKRNRILNL